MNGNVLQDRFSLLQQNVAMSRERPPMTVDPMQTAVREAVQDRGWKQDLMEVVKEQESFVPNIYQDPAGGPAIGYGHRLQAGEVFKRPLTEPQAEGLLLEDIDKRIELTSGYWDKHHKTPFHSLPDDAKSILVDFVYNLGVTGLDKYKNLRRAIDKGDWNKIAKEYKRYWTPTGSRRVKPLTKRNKAIFEKFIEPNLRR